MASRPTSRQTILPSQFQQHTRTGSNFSLNPSSTSSATNPSHSALQTRINEKKLELDSLKQLRDLSAGLAGQMQQLEDKLSTLSDGTEAVAAVMGNWNTVLRAVYMASQKIPKPQREEGEGEDGKEHGQQQQQQEEQALPQTLVRIPIQQAEAVMREQENKASEKKAVDEGD